MNTGVGILTTSGFALRQKNREVKKVKYVIDVPENTMYVTAFVDCGDGSYCTTKHKHDGMERYVDVNRQDSEDEV